MLTDDYMRTQIRDSMRLKGTDELLEIWRTADHDEWTDLAFEVVKEILVERLGAIPSEKPVKRAPRMMRPNLKHPTQAPSAGEIQEFERQQTYETLNEMDTDELIEIIRDPDHEQLTGLGYEVAKQILAERIGPLGTPESDETEASAASGPGWLFNEETTKDEVTAEDEDTAEEANAPVVNLLDNLVGLRCPQCKGSIAEQDRFCSHCGLDLETPLDDSELQSLAAEHLDKAQKGLDLGRDLKGALAECDLALECAPNSAEAHNLRGLILDEFGKTYMAVSEYKEALRLDPTLRDAFDNLADAEAELRSRNY